MAAPSFVDAQAGATDAGGTWGYTCQASGAAGRIFIVQALQDGSTNGAVTFSTVTSNIVNLAGGTSGGVGWEFIPGPNADSSWPVGGSSEARQFLLIGRATGTGAPTIGGGNSTSEDLYIRSYQFTDVSTGTTLATVIENIGGTDDLYVNTAATDGTITDSAVTTDGPDRLALQFIGISDDNALADFTGETGGDWTEAVAEYAESSGTDATIGLQIAYPWDIGAAFAAAAGNEPVYGSGGAEEEQAQSFASGAGGTVAAIHVALSKVGSPTDNLVVEIQTNNAGVPSGTVVGSSGSLSAASVATTVGWYSIPVSATLSASTTYHVVLRRDGSRDTANFVRFLQGDATSSTYADGTASHRASGTWSNDTWDFGFGISYGAGSTINGGTTTNSDAADGWGVVGFALIGTTVAAAYVPRNPGIHFNDPAIV